MTQRIKYYVKQYIDGDPVIKVGIQRGLITSRVLTKHILDNEKSFKGFFDDVRNAVRGYTEDCEVLVDVNKSFHAFRNCSIDVRGKLACVALSGNTSFKHMLTILENFSKRNGSFVRVLNNASSFSLILQEQEVDEFSSVVGKDSISNIEGSLCAVILHLDSSVKQTPGIYFFIMGQIALERINIYDVVSYQTEFTLYVSQKDSARVYQILWELCDYHRRFLCSG